MRTWVIGGTSGIGKAIAEHCRSMGGFVVATGKDEADVTFYYGLKKIWETQGPFSHVVYSAGINRLMWISDMDLDDAAHIYQVNVLGFVNVLRLIAGDMLSSCTSVVAISSDAATRPMRTSLAYCASKAALDMAVRVAARELAPIRINAVSPGMTAGTAMTEYIDEAVPLMRGWTPDESRKYETSQIPMARRADPMEIAQVVYSVLIGPQYMTGSIVNVNGGR